MSVVRASLCAMFSLPFRRTDPVNDAVGLALQRMSVVSMPESRRILRRHVDKQPGRRLWRELPGRHHPDNPRILNPAPLTPAIEVDRG